MSGHEVPDDPEARRNFIPDDPTDDPNFDPSKWTGTIMSGLIRSRVTIEPGPLPFGECGCGSTSCAVLTQDHKCGCLRCNPGAWWMVTCDQCGDKRCGRSVSHSYPCDNAKPTQETS